MQKLILVLALMTILAVAGCGSRDGSDALYKDGTYRGDAEGGRGNLVVEVKVSGGQITAVETVEHQETEGIADPALEQVPAQIIELQGTEGVDIVSGATATSNAIIAAVNEALTGAK